jgi:formylglycine-generating enzyme required for sulfatase activity
MKCAYWLGAVGAVAVMAGALVAQAPSSEPPKEFTNGIGMRFVWIPPGTFEMGSPPKEEGRKQDEARHKVTLTRGFYMGVYPVTREQWKAVMGKDLNNFKSAKNLPVDWVSWDDCHEFLQKMGAKDGHAYRLPTEAEWEYACRAGSNGAYCYGDDPTRLYPYAWYSENSGLVHTHPVGQKKPNAWGIHDMHGNVLQWCADWYGEYSQGSVVDPKGPFSEPVPIAAFIRQLSSPNFSERQGATTALKEIGWRALPALRMATLDGPDLETRRRAQLLVAAIRDPGEGRVLRGGSFYDKASDVRAASRAKNVPVGRYYCFGFRAVRTITPK